MLARCHGLLGHSAIVKVVSNTCAFPTMTMSAVNCRKTIAPVHV